MVGLDEDFEPIELQRKNTKSIKGPQSKERKLSNEENWLLPPRANNCEMLRPSKCSKTSTILSKSENSSKQALKPMTILGFLKLSCRDKLLELPGMEGIEKADTILQTSSLISGTIGKVGVQLPAFAMG